MKVVDCDFCVWVHACLCFCNVDDSNGQGEGVSLLLDANLPDIEDQDFFLENCDSHLFHMRKQK